MRHFYPLALTLLSVVACRLGLCEERAKVPPLFPVHLEEKFENPKGTFEEVKQLILDHYYSDDITEEALYMAAIKGMLRFISPPEHPELAAIWKPEDYEKVENSLKGVQVSIGIRSSFNANDGSLTVTEVMENSPAEGVVMPLDRVLRIDGKALKGIDVKKIDSMLNGEVGTSVTLTIVRDIKVFDVTITREQFKVHNVTASILPGNIGYLEIHRITANVSKEVKAELDKMKDQGVGKLILDLRYNGGGVFAEASRILDLFLPAKKIILRTVTRDKGLQNYVTADAEEEKFSMAVLVNEATGSSAEIIAAGLRDHGLGLLVGTHTYGKSVFEKTFNLENGYHVKFIVGSMYTPRGVSWNARGLIPDFAADLDDNVYKVVKKWKPEDRLKKDVPLLTAYKLLNRQK